MFSKFHFSDYFSVFLWSFDIIVSDPSVWIILFCQIIVLFFSSALGSVFPIVLCTSIPDYSGSEWTLSSSQTCFPVYLISVDVPNPHLSPFHRILSVASVCWFYFHGIVSLLSIPANSGTVLNTCWCKRYNRFLKWVGPFFFFSFQEQCRLGIIFYLRVWQTSPIRAFRLRFFFFPLERNLSTISVYLIAVALCSYLLVMWIFVFNVFLQKFIYWAFKSSVIWFSRSSFFFKFLWLDILVHSIISHVYICIFENFQPFSPFY